MAMANTTATKGNMVMVTGLDADWNSESDLGIEWLKVKSIQYTPGDTNDVFIIHEGANDGPKIFQEKATATTDQIIKRFGGDGTWMRPYIDISECTVGTAATATLMFELA